MFILKNVELGSAEGGKVKFAANGDKDAVENDILVISLIWKS